MGPAGDMDWRLVIKYIVTVQLMMVLMGQRMSKVSRAAMSYLKGSRLNTNLQVAVSHSVCHGW